MDSGVREDRATARAWAIFDELFVRHRNGFKRRVHVCQFLHGAEEEGIAIPNRTKDPTNTELIRDAWENAMVKAINEFFRRVTRIIKAGGELAAKSSELTPNHTPKVRGILTAEVFQIKLNTETQVLRDNLGNINEVNVKLFVDKGQVFADAQIETSPNVAQGPDIAIIFDIPPPIELQRAIVENTGSLITKLTGEMQERIMATFRESVLAGRGPAGVAQDIRDASLDFSLSRARMIARTEGIRSFNEGAKARYQARNIPRVQWAAALDERTDQDCEDLHGQVFDVNNTPVDPPLHPNCRCVWLPVARSRTQRSGTGPPVPATAQFFDIKTGKEISRETGEIIDTGAEA